MIVVRRNAVSKSLARHYKLIASLVILGTVSYALATHQGLLAGMLEGGARSGKLARLQFTLREGGDFAVTSAAWNPDARYIATGSMYVREIHIWDVRRQRIVQKLPLPYPPANFHQLAWSPNGQFLAACDGTGVLRIYNAGTWQPAHVFTELHQIGGCNHPAFSGDSSQIATIGAKLVVYSVPSWRMLLSVSLRDGWAKGDLIDAVAYVPHTSTIAVGGGQYLRKLGNGEDEPWDGRVWLFCGKAKVPCQSFAVYPPAGGHAGGGPVSNIALSPDGQTVATATNTGVVGPGGTPIEPVHVIRLLDGETLGAPLDGLPPFGGASGLAYTSDNRYIIVGHEQADGAIHIVSARSYRVIDFLQARGFVYDISVNYRNEFAVGAGNKVVIWSLPR